MYAVDLPPSLRSQTGGQSQGTARAVHDVQVVARGTLPEQVSDLVQRPVESDHFGDVGVVVCGFEATQQPLRQGCAAQGGETLDLLEGEHRHDAGDNRDRYSPSVAACDEVEVDRVVEEQLGCDEGGSGVDLSFQRVEVRIKGCRFGVLFGITGDAEAEIRMAVLEQDNQLAGVTQAVGCDRKTGGASGGIAAECHDVSEAIRVDAIRQRGKLGAGMSDAGEVGHDREAEVIFQNGADLTGPIARASACPVGDRNEIG